MRTASSQRLTELTGNSSNRIERSTLTVSSHVVHAIAMLRGVGSKRTRALNESEGEALAVIYRAYSGMLIAVLRQLLGSQEDAEDVLHDVFARLPWAIAQYREDSFGGWLRQVAVRGALTRLRSDRRRRECSLPDPECLPVDDVLPVDFEALERREELTRAVAHLPESLRQVIVLRVFCEYSHQEVAKALDISVTASEVRMCRALKQLRAMLRHRTLSVPDGK